MALISCIRILGDVPKTPLYSFNQTQGGAWINTGIDVTNLTAIMFERVDNGTVILQIAIAKASIAVYTGGQDVYTNIYTQNGKPMNVRIYNSILYASYNGTGPASYATNIYSHEFN